MTSGFRLDRVTVTRGDARLLNTVSADLPAGQCTAIVGVSGAGKSTLLRLLNRLEDPSSGRVLLDDVALTEFGVIALRRRVGLVAQRPVVLTDHVSDDLRVAQTAARSPHRSATTPARTAPTAKPPSRHNRYTPTARARHAGWATSPIVASRVG